MRGEWLVTDCWDRSEGVEWETRVVLAYLLAHKLIICIKYSVHVR